DLARPVDPAPGADAVAGSDEGGEPHLVEPVVDRPARGVESEQFRTEPWDERQGEVAVGHGRADLRRGRPPGVDVDPLVVLGDVCEAVYPVLGYGEPFAGAEFGASGAFELVYGPERDCHWYSVFVGR